MLWALLASPGTYLPLCVFEELMRACRTIYQLVFVALCCRQFCDLCAQVKSFSHVLVSSGINPLLFGRSAECESYIYCVLLLCCFVLLLQRVVYYIVTGNNDIEFASQTELYCYSFRSPHGSGSDLRMYSPVLDTKRSFGCKRVGFLVKEPDVWCGQHSKRVHRM